MGVSETMRPYSRGGNKWEHMFVAPTHGGTGQGIHRQGLDVSLNVNGK